MTDSNERARRRSDERRSECRLRTLMAGAGLPGSRSDPSGRCKCGQRNTRGHLQPGAPQRQAAEERLQARQLEGREDRCGSTGSPQILPSKVIDLQLPAGEVTFNPGNVPVCPDSAVGPPPTDLSQPVPNIMSRAARTRFSATAGRSSRSARLTDGACWTASWSSSMAASRTATAGQGLLLLLRHQRRRLHRSGPAPDGSLIFQVPQLTADSSVTALNLEIPGRNVTLDATRVATTVILPKGQKRLRPGQVLNRQLALERRLHIRHPRHQR